METRPSGKIEAQGLGIAAVSDKVDVAIRSTQTQLIRSSRGMKSDEG